MTDSRVQNLIGQIKAKYPKSEIDRVFSDNGAQLEGYSDDPVGFIQNEMGITLTDDIAKMAESVRDNKITVARSATGTGKSHGASALAIWFKKCHKRSQVFTVAHPFENQTILWGELATMAEQSGLFVSDTINNMEIQCQGGRKEFIKALSVPTVGTDEVKEGKFSGKHYDHMLFIVDEGDTVPDFAYRGIEGCMSGGHVRLLILFNPRYEAGTPYRHEYDRTANIIHLSAFTHPNVVTGDDIIPGAVNRETTVQRINEWCRPLAGDEQPSINTFELPQFLVGCVSRKKGTNDEYPPLRGGQYYINEPAFWYMVLGEYPPQPEGQLISREWVDNARSRWDAYVAKNGETPPYGIKPIIGGDVADGGQDNNCLCARYGGFVARLKKWNGVDADKASIRFATEHKELGASVSYIDGTGVGAGVAPAMQRMGCTAVKVMVASSPTAVCDLGTFQQVRDQFYWACREWLRTDPGAMLPPDDRLVQQLLTPTYRVHNGKLKVMPKNPTEGKVCMRDLLKYSPDEMESLVMTFADTQLILGGLDLS